MLHLLHVLTSFSTILLLAGVPVNGDTALILLINPIAEIADSFIFMNICHRLTVPLLITATKNSRHGLLLPWLILATLGLVALPALPVVIGAVLLLSGSLGIVMSIGSICVTGLLLIFIILGLGA